MLYSNLHEETNTSEFIFINPDDPEWALPEGRVEKLKGSGLALKLPIENQSELDKLVEFVNKHYV